MVSIKTVLTLAAVGVGVVLFFGAGGFKGVGSKIGGFVGGGLSDFSSSITSAFTGGLFGGNQSPTQGGVNQDTGTIGPPPRTGTEAFDPFGNLIGNFKGLQNILDSINNAISNAFLPQAGAVKLTGIDRSFALGRLRPIGGTFSEGFRTSQGLKVFAQQVAPSERFPSGRIIAVRPETRKILESRGFVFG